MPLGLVLGGTPAGRFGRLVVLLQLALLVALHLFPVAALLGVAFALLLLDEAVALLLLALGLTLIALVDAIALPLALQAVAFTIQALAFGPGAAVVIAGVDGAGVIDHTAIAVVAGAIARAVAGVVIAVVAVTAIAGIHAQALSTPAAPTMARSLARDQSREGREA